MTVLPLPYRATVPNLVRAAHGFGAREYIVTGRRRLTFADLEQQSRRLAKRLLRSGVGKGTRVALLFAQGPDFIVTFVAITRIGAVAVPLSTFFRGPELRRAVRHADVAVVIAQRTLATHDIAELFESAWPQLPTMRGPELFLTDAPFLRQIWLCSGADGDGADGDGAGGDRGGDGRAWMTRTPAPAELDDDPTLDEFLEEVESEVAPSDLLAIILTSGATAEPKAVVHTHGSQVRHAWTLAQLYGLDRDDRTFTTMPFFWVGGLTVTLLTHLHVGAAVITVDRMDTAEMLDLIEATRPTRMIGWTLRERLAGDPTYATRDLGWLSELMSTTAPGASTRHNSLGMSETGGPHTAAPSQDHAGGLPERLHGSFGPPVPGVEHRIVDPATGEVLGEGVEGEICVRGVSLMDGLYKQERADTFDADGWYHTADRGCFREGFLFFTGRSNEMIKTGGANVAPREIEVALESFDSVKAAFAVGLPDAERGQIVGCVVCPEPGHDIDPHELADRLRDQLSSYKVPRRIVVVPYDDVPWLPSGKVSKPRLAELLARPLP